MSKTRTRGFLAIRKILSVLIFLALTAEVQAVANKKTEVQIISTTAPVEHFKISGFDKDNGWRNWQLEGSKAVFAADGSVNVTGMRLRVYEPSDRQIVNMLIESPLAVMQKDKQSISGPGSIIMNSKGIFLGGENWTWVPDDRKLTIRTHTHTVIEGEFGPILE
jgi:hypothetical protein